MTLDELVDKAKRDPSHKLTLGRLMECDARLGDACLRMVEEKLTGKIVLELYFVKGVAEQPFHLSLRSDH